MAKKKLRKRQNGDGSVFQRADGKWVARITFRDGRGKLRTKERSAPSRERANLLRRELLQFKLSGRAETESIAMTVGGLIEIWNRIVVKESFAESTQDSYGRAIEKLILDNLGAIPLVNLSPLQIELWISEMTSMRVTNSVKQKAFRVLSSALGYAVRKKILPLNPCDDAVSPSCPAKEISIFSAREVSAILDAAQGLRTEGIYETGLQLGLRQGEIFGLQWPDFNPHRMTLSIQRQVAEASGRLYLREPKTKAGKRVIEIDGEIAEIFFRRRDFALKEGLATSPWIFPGRGGSPFRRSNFGHRHWRPLLEKLGITHRGFHHARHTAATIMLTEGISPQTVSHLLGHSSPVVTLRLYSHLIPKDTRRATAAVRKAIRSDDTLVPLMNESAGTPIL